jgi:hypothetical protein
MTSSPKNEYLLNLQERYEFCKQTIRAAAAKDGVNGVPTDVFYFRIKNGSLKEKLDDEEWLEMAVDRLTLLIDKINENDTRNTYKKIVGTHLNNTLTTI